MNNEQIIQKCYGITTISHEMNQAALKHNKRKFDKYEAELKFLIKKLIQVIKDES